MTEKRFFGVENIRATDGNQPKIVGRVPFDSWSEPLAFGREILRRGCFSRALASGKPIFSFWSHDQNKVLGSTAAGTLDLRESAEGLEITVLPDPEVSWSKDAIRAIGRGDVRGFSFGFRVDPAGYRETKQGREIVEIANLYEVSPCAMPAYSASSAAVRHRGQKGNTPMTLQERLAAAMDQLEKLTPADGAPYYRAAAEADKCLRDLGVDVSVANDGLAVVKYYVRASNGPAYRVPDLGDDDHHFTAGEDYSRIYAPDRRGFGEYLRDVRRAMQPGGVRSEKLDTLEKRAAGDGLVAFGAPSDGGFAVADEHVDEIGKFFKSNDVIKRCRNFYIEGNTLRIPAVDEKSRADGSRAGGVQGYWTAELAQIQSSAAKFKMTNFQLEKLTAMVFCSDEILDDYVTLGDFVTEALARELMFKLQDAVVNGIGAGMPLGIINSGALVTVGKETGQASDCIVTENVLKMYARFCPSGIGGGAVWLGNRNILPQLYTLSYDIGTGGEMARLYVPGNGPDATGSMLGYPVIFIEQCPTLGDLGDLILCDLREYYLIQKRGGVKTDMSIHLKFDYGQSAFRAVLRAEGQPAWSSPLAPFRGSSTISPFVALEARE